MLLFLNQSPCSGYSFTCLHFLLFKKITKNSLIDKITNDLTGLCLTDKINIHESILI